MVFISQSPSDFFPYSLLSQNIVMIGGVVQVPVRRNNRRGVWYREVDVTLSSMLFFTWFSIRPTRSNITDAQRYDNYVSFLAVILFEEVTAKWRVAV